MKEFLLLLIAIAVLAGCSTLPSPDKSSFVRVEVAGHTWRKDGTANAVFEADVLAKHRLPFFVEISLPNPDGGSPEILRKEIKESDSRIEAEGELRAGWVPNAVYEYRMKIYEDAGYAVLLDDVVQPSRCVRPPSSLLEQLAEPGASHNGGKPPRES